ncbi:hypothetical protein K502DRAFT_49775 [Neoconidiobolus thromboides FSU 785]|nr:hypothetical protein K502DRAFT_49775 [Neoconidiobolus thromboides FSU 785]
MTNFYPLIVPILKYEFIYSRACVYYQELKKGIFFILRLTDMSNISFFLPSLFLIATFFKSLIISLKNF